MRIKTFYAYSDKGLDKKVNNFLEENKVYVVDIKFSVSLLYVSAMVVYKTNFGE